jgi:Rhodanese-like domain
MRVLISFAIIALTALVLIGCNSAQRTTAGSPVAKAPSSASPHATPDGVRRITPAELQDLVAKGKAFVVDVRTEAAYKQAHIPGAVLIPTNQVLNRVKEFPRDKTIVTYCS